jgi:hypothetical protein
MAIARVLFLKTKPICNPNFHNENRSEISDRSACASKNSDNVMPMGIFAPSIFIADRYRKSPH